MKAFEKLLSLEHHNLEVFANCLGVCVRYKGADVLEGACRKGEYGTGNSFEEACDDYLNKISGKKLIFGYGEKREEITIL